MLAGIAGLLAGAFSMALGEWVSVTSSREAAEAQLAVEREEIELMPEAEQEELALIYQAKGLPEAEAQSLAAQIMSDPETALSTLAREELGLIPEELGSPWTAAIASFLLFSAGATLPVLPFLFSGRLRRRGRQRRALGGRAVRGRRRDHAADGTQRVVLGAAPGGAGPRRSRGGRSGIGTLVGNVAGI